MIVLQLSVLEDRLMVWGESPPQTTPQAPKRGRKIKAPEVPQRPFSPLDPGANALAEAVALVGLGAGRALADAQRVTAWLPTVDQHPIPSTRLIAEGPASLEGVALTPWSVLVLEVTPEQILDLLGIAPGRPTLAPGVVAGSTLAYWQRVLDLAAGAAVRQQFLPGLAWSDGQAVARWTATLTGPDAPRLAKLATAMPEACRALTRPKVTTPPDRPKPEVLGLVLDVLVDRIVRSGQALDLDGMKAVGKPKARSRPSSFDSLHEQWLHALRSDNPALDADPGELQQLTERLEDWRRAATLTSSSPFRLCFRLDDPRPGPSVNGPPTDPWRLDFLLQASDDPSLLIPAGGAWRPKGTRATLFRQKGFDPTEYLLASLGQAARLDPKIERSLKDAEPSGCDLDAAEAGEFLAQSAGQLEQAGFGVFLPRWWTRKGKKTAVTATAVVQGPKFRGKSILSLESLLEVQWEVALGGQPISLKELRALARLKSPLVWFRGQWVMLDAKEIQEALAYWESKEGKTAKLGDVLRLAIGGESPVAGVEVEGVKADGWIGEFLEQVTDAKGFETLPVPEGFRGTLRPYQQRGYSWMGFLRRWGLGACLADDMGLGKTVQTLTLLQHDWAEADPGERRPTLLICPMSVVGNWRKEAEKFTPDLPVLVHHGLGRAKGAAFARLAKKHALVVSSYSLLHRDAKALSKVDWAGVVLDEAQNIKNPHTKQSQSARSLGGGFRIALTGTPVENNVGDLWSIMEFLNPGFLGPLATFKRRFFLPIQNRRDPEAMTALRRLTGPFVLRRLKTDKSIIADLPDKLEMTVFCTLTKEQATLYESTTQSILEAIDAAEGIQRKGMVLSLLTRLKQICNHPAHFLGDNSPIPSRSGKLQRLVEMLEEVLSVGERALVFTQYAEMGEILRKYLEETFGEEVFFLHGGVSKSRRDEMVERFQAKDGSGPKLFVLSLKAGGTGLTLTKANHVFHYDRWWNPAVENQATDRAFRIGQTKNVQVHKLLCAGTMEERIDELINSKKEVAALTVGAGEDWLTKLSTTELRDLFSLRSDAVGDE